MFAFLGFRGGAQPADRQRHGQGDRAGVPLAMLESGKYATIREIAAIEKINETYIGRVLRLTLLAPDIVEAILGGRQPAELQLDGLMKRFPVAWTEQQKVLLVRSPRFSTNPPARGA